VIFNSFRLVRFGEHLHDYQAVGEEQVPRHDVRVEPVPAS
jgi:hypothetical protein